MHYVFAVVEDMLQEVVLRKLLATYRRDIELSDVLGYRGNTYIREKLVGFNYAASQGLPHIAVTDLDNNPCASNLLKLWVNFDIHSNLLFRIAVREVEAWIMADREAFARFMGVAINRIHKNTEEIKDPKLHVINLARQTRKRSIKDIIPIGIGSQGPGYNSILSGFVRDNWNPDNASANNYSLNKTIERLKEYLEGSLIK